jgi:hypothetical protein
MNFKDQHCTGYAVPFQMIGSPNSSTTGYSFCSRARINTENRNSLVKYHNPQTPKNPLFGEANSNKACAIYGRYSICLLAEV